MMMGPWERERGFGLSSVVVVVWVCGPADGRSGRGEARWCFLGGRIARLAGMWRGGLGVVLVSTIPRWRALGREGKISSEGRRVDALVLSLYTVRASTWW